MLNTKLFDHTILKADATEAQVAKICDEALAHDFASVCVNQYYTKFVAEKLKGSDVKVCTVVGFPLGMSDTRVKAFETRTAIEDGAQEVDMVINVGALKDGKYDFVRSDIQTLKEVCDQYSVMGEITEMNTTKNAVTGERVYELGLVCNDVPIDICINEKDLFGVPEVGRRFKGQIWLQGMLEHL